MEVATFEEKKEFVSLLISHNVLTELKSRGVSQLTQVGNSVENPKTKTSVLS